MAIQRTTAGFTLHETPCVGDLEEMIPSVGVARCARLLPYFIVSRYYLLKTATFLRAGNHGITLLIEDMHACNNHETVLYSEDTVCILVSDYRH